VAFLGELQPDTRLVLEKDARLTLIYVESGTEFTLAGPGEFVVEAAEVKTVKGPVPTRRVVATRPDPTIVTRLAETATASVRMRSASMPKAASARPALLYPRGTPIATLQPTLSWSADPPPDGFTVVVTAADGKQAWRGTSKSTSAKVGVKLASASRYGWTAPRRRSERRRNPQLLGRNPGNRAAYPFLVFPITPRSGERSCRDCSTSSPVPGRWNSPTAHPTRPATSRKRRPLRPAAGSR
jgi:hypothetical protein